MKKLYWILLLIPLLQACATHAPMSEMVMFNTRVDTATGKVPNRGGGLSLYFEGISDSQFEKKRKVDFEQFLLIEEPISLSMFKMKDDDFAYGASFFHGFGVDVTKKLIKHTYVTASVSANSSSKVILQNRVNIDEQLGLAIGLFYGLSYRGYYNYSDCIDDEPCGGSFSIEPVDHDYLKNAGLRTRFILRSGQEMGIALTGFLEYGRLFEVDDNFLGVGVSFIGF